MTKVYSAKWILAMQAEVKGKYDVHHAWEYVTKIPSNRKLMKGKGVFSIKYKDDGSVKLYKARWVGCGYSQIEGVDYNETYGSTLLITPVRLFFAAACIHDWEITEIDTVKAFTQATFEDDE